ncbi:MAG: hypothetical protein A2091_08335 [Desulfuromonadales bacterium GWD2_61_12]|nr:MAG: hypothetical protein A2005_08565 [Desulfuromonadales bacterium GWC2_61_20]OGR33704.1 MAG: hypothetical protein A2091_08335 [Desulfuromonadales bacterium GWD2_61_12]HAD04081.1 hypothetical protein [Desulfuromonas sp.]
MAKTLNKRLIFSTLGAIFLGVLSSGVYELVKPLLGPSWSGILTVATFGLDSLRDAIYADAAHVFESPLGLGVAVQTLAGVILITGVAIIGYIRATSQLTAPFLARVSYLLLFFGAITMFITASRSTYVNRLARHHSQLETMAAPYLADLELKKLRSEFVQVNNRRLYLQQLEKLQKIISDNHGYPPYQYFF